MATGSGRQLAAQHSHSLEGWYAHIPGLKVLAPGTIEDMRGMLWSALQDPDPVLIFENSFLYPMSGSIPADLTEVDISKAKVMRTGRDITVVAYGGGIQKALKAAELLVAEGLDPEVIDLRVLRPLDSDTVIESVRKTHRLVIVDDGWKSGSLAAELMARVMEDAFYELDAPIERICGVEVPIPYPQHLEQAAVPQPETIADAVRKVVSANG